jgi:hypothetical protein
VDELGQEIVVQIYHQRVAVQLGGLGTNIHSVAQVEHGA